MVNNTATYYVQCRSWLVTTVRGSGHGMQKPSARHSDGLTERTRRVHFIRREYPIIDSKART